MGQHVWLLTATIVTELLVITKWSQGMFTTPTPPSVKVGLTAGTVLLILYPIMQVRDLPHPRYSDLTVSPTVRLTCHPSIYPETSEESKKEDSLKFPALFWPFLTAEPND